MHGCDVRLSGQPVIINVGVINQLNATILVCSEEKKPYQTLLVFHVLYAK